MRGLLLLGQLTGRDVIIPNVLGNDRQTDGPRFDELSLWPGFRVLFTRKGFDLPINILEPAYYWRIRRDYPAYTVPPATVVVVDRSAAAAAVRGDRGGRGGRGGGGGMTVSLVDVLTLLQSEQYRDQPRIVLSINMTGGMDRVTAGAESMDSSQQHLHRYHHRLMLWADDSVGRYSSFEEESGRYEALPGLVEQADNTFDKSTQSQSLHHHYLSIMRSITRGTRLCADVFVFDKGNRSCFDKCD